MKKQVDILFGSSSGFQCLTECFSPPPQRNRPLGCQRHPGSTARASLGHPNQTRPPCIGHRGEARRRGWLEVWSALALSWSFLAASLHAQFAYVANLNGNTVSGYTIDPTSGVLSAITGSPFPTGLTPNGVGVALGGKFAYVATSVRLRGV